MGIYTALVLTTTSLSTRTPTHAARITPLATIAPTIVSVVPPLGRCYAPSRRCHRCSRPQSLLLQLQQLLLLLLLLVAAHEDRSQRAVDDGKDAHSLLGDKAHKVLVVPQTQRPLRHLQVGTLHAPRQHTQQLLRDARELGGRRLVEECIRFARRVDFAKVILWTDASLLAARAIYEQAGFRLIHQEPHHSFGHDLIGENWELVLRAQNPGLAASRARP